MAQETNLKVGDIRTIIADEPALGYTFTGWTGDIAYLDDPSASTTTVTMPDANVTVTAVYGETPITNVKYGYLYNFYTVLDSRNIANTGWHVMTKTEREYYRITYWPGASGGGDLKEAGFVYFDPPNTGATNSVGFNGRGSGSRNADGTFTGINGVANIFTVDPLDLSVVTLLRLAYTNSLLSAGTTTPLTIGYSVRLVKDSTTLTHGQTGKYIGNDGKAYNTICIGNYEILANDLAETKYRNGDLIPTVTDNATWAALTTGAKCAYDNDESNVLI